MNQREIHQSTLNTVKLINKSGTTVLYPSACKYHDDFQNLEFDNVILCSTHFEQSTVIGKVFCIKMNESELLGKLCKMGVKLNAVINLHNRPYEEDCRQMAFFNKMMPLFADDILYFSTRDFFTQESLDAPVTLEPVALPGFVKLFQKHSNALEETITGWGIKKINTPPTSLTFPHVELVLYRDSIWGKVDQFDMTFMKRPTNPHDSGEGYNDRWNAIRNYLKGFGVSERKLKYFDRKQEYPQSILPLLEEAATKKLKSVACIPFSGGGYEIIHEQLKNWTGEFPKEIHVFHLHKDDFDYFYKLPEAVTALRINKYETDKFLSEIKINLVDLTLDELLEKISPLNQVDKQKILELFVKEKRIPYTHDNLAELISKIGQNYGYENAIDICCGTGKILNYLDKSKKLKGVDIKSDIVQMASFMNPEIDFITANTLEYEFTDETYDLVVGDLPLGGVVDGTPSKSLDVELIKKSLELLSDNGVAIFVIHDGLLANTTNTNYAKLRSDLINNFSLDMVISLPIGVLRPYYGGKLSVIVIRNGIKKSDIFMPNFEDDTSAIVDDFNNHSDRHFYLPQIDIDNESFRLNKNYYLSKIEAAKILAGYDTQKLSDISEIIRGEAFTSNVNSDGLYSAFRQPEKKISSIQNKDSILRSRDIVISLIVYSTKKKQIHFYEENFQLTVISPNYIIIRIRNNQDREYLSAYLQTEDWQTLVKTCFIGSTIEKISISKLEELQIPRLPEDELNQKRLETAKQNGDDDYFLEQIEKHLQARDYEKAKELNEEISDLKRKSENLKHIETLETLELKELEIKNKTLEMQIQHERALHEKEKEMLSFFTHTMRNALATAPESLREVIRLLGSDDYEKNTKHYKAINKIVTLFSTLSLTDCLIDTFKQSISDQKEFKQSWQNDCDGDATPKWVIASALRQSLNRIIFMSDTDKLKMLLNNQETEAVKSTRKSFIDNVLPLDVDAQGITAFYDWVGCINLIEIAIDENNTPHFGTNQVKFSLLFSITSELILNALKYWSGVGRIQISWQVHEEYYVFTVKNPCEANASSNLAGTHKGVAFIKRLMELLGEQAAFHCSQEEQSFVAELKLHKTLLEG